MIEVQVKRLNDKAKLPTYGSTFAAGLDLYSCEDLIIEPQSRAIVKTGIAIDIKDSLYHGFIWPRSGLSSKNGIDVLGGVIDNDYIGEIMVILFNSDKSKSLEVKTGDRIAQLVLQKVPDCELVDMTNHGLKAEGKQRGESGFGSTGR